MCSENSLHITKATISELTVNLRDGRSQQALWCRKENSSFLLQCYQSDNSVKNLEKSY